MSSSKAKLKSILAFCLVFGPASALIFISTRGCTHQFQELDDFGLMTIDSFEIYNQSSNTFTKKALSDFQGDILFINSIQPNCPGNCNISMWHFEQLIYNHIYENKHKKLKQVKIISFLTDNQGVNLKKTKLFEDMTESFRQNLENYDPDIWMLAKGNAQSVYDFDHNGENLLHSAEREYGKAAYLKYLLLIDKNSHLRMVLPADKEGEIRVMFEHLALLQKEYSIKNK